MDWKFECVVIFYTNISSFFFAVVLQLFDFF